MNNPQSKPIKRKPMLLILLLLVVLLAAGAGAWQTVQASKLSATQATATPVSTYSTSTVKKSDIAVSVTGTGKAVASNSVDLAFSSGGNIAELDVAIGDSVKAGQTLAVLDTLTSLQTAITNNQLSLTIAQQTLDALKTNAPTALGQALADQAAAQAALVDAQNGLHDPHDWRCPDNKTAAYYQAYLDAMVQARPWQAKLGSATEVQKQYYIENLKPILKKMELAYENYTYCQAYTPQEITASQANLQTAKANLAKATSVYTTLKANNGIDPTDLTTAEANVADAKVQLTKSQDDLQAATMKAPIDGKITYLNGTVGQPAGSATLITIVDTSTLAVKATLDEADLGNVALNCPAAVEFSMLSGKTFDGTVTTISPELVSSNGASMVEVMVTLKNPVGPALGATASVAVTCAKSQNALVIPTIAIKEIAGKNGTVYVLNSLGQPEKRAVEIGINTGVTAEILSGLKEGEKVIISEVKIP